ncbi:type VI protein secretion system component VasF [Bradyrhizobium sp. USDA 4486]
MNLTVFQDSAAGVAVRYSPLLLLGRPWSRRKTLRRRRKIPSWVGLALLVLVADVAMSVLAWFAVSVVLH